MNGAWNPGRRGLGAILVALFGLVGAIYLGSGARNSALDAAARTVSAALPAALDQEAGEASRAAVQRLVRNRSSALIFATVRAPDRRVLASDGAWSGWFSGVVAQSTARTWRAWAYRALCADGRRPIAGGGQAHIGVSWWHVLLSAGPVFWLMILLSGLGGLLAVREARQRSAPASEARPSRSDARRNAQQPSGAWRGRALALGERLRNARSFGRRAPSASAHRQAAASRNEGAGFQPIGRRAPAASASSPAPRRPGSDTSAEPAAERSQPETTPAAEADDALVPASDTTTAGFFPDRLRLGFQPIWRGATAGLLAGGAVRFVPDQATADRPVPLDRLLAAEADDVPARRELTQWIARRLSTLQANWRTLELPQIPLMVRLPEALFAFEQADRVWNDALADCQPEPGELVFCVEQLPAVARALPVRWAVREDGGRDGAACYRLQAASADAEELAREGDIGGRFAWPDRDEARDKPSDLLGARDFARLISRCDLAPI